MAPNKSNIPNNEVKPTKGARSIAELIPMILTAIGEQHVIILITMPTTPSAPPSLHLQRFLILYATSAIFILINMVTIIAVGTRTLNR